MRFLAERARVGFWIGLVMLAAIAATGYWNTTGLLATTERISQSREVLGGLDALLARVTAAETRRERYLRTSSREDLAAYERTVASATDALSSSARTLMAADPSQRARLDRLVALTTPEPVTAAGEGTRTIDAIRGLVADMQRAERLALREHSTAARVRVRRVSLVMVVGGLLSLLLVGATHATVIRGMAERRRAKEAAEAANHSKSAFLANVSHEIRTPMTAILGYADLLTDPDLSAKERADYLTTIRRNGDHLLAIVNDVLDLSKIEAGKTALERIASSPPALVAEIVSMMQSRALHKGLTLDVAYRGAIPDTIQADPTRLRQILINLIGNAIKFTETGGVRLEVSMKQADSPARPQLRFDVIDTGLGLTADQQETLFLPFTQADASTTRKFGGTGLGLTISKRLAQMLGGDITVSSVACKGSRFTLTVDTGPLEGVVMLDNPGEAVRRAASVVPKREEGIRLRGRILLAEDGPDNQRLIAFYLRKAGADVTIAENGLTACEKTLQAADAGGPFDVVLMDMHMPELDGYGATARLREHGYRGPIVALTANAMDQDREKCLRAGCDDFMSKPVPRRMLLETVRKHLGAGHDGAMQAPGEEGGPLVSDLAGDPDLEPLLEKFVKLLPKRIDAMERTFVNRDIPALADLAHQLKGAAGSYGFRGITEAAHHLEATAKTQGDVEQTLAELVALCRRAQPRQPAP